MMVLTVQRYSEIVKAYSNIGYVPEFSKSPYAYLSPRFTKGYMTVLDELAKKTNERYIEGIDTCIWGWVNNPFLGFYPNNSGKSKSERLYAVFCNIDERNLVMTDYDKFCNYVQGYSESKDFFVKDFKYGDCVQCSFWKLKYSDISLVVDLDMLKSNNFIQEIYNGRMNDVSYMFKPSYRKFIRTTVGVC